MRERIDQFCRREEEGMFRLLRDLVLQPSPSRCKQGVDAVGARLAAALQTSGLDLETVRQSEFGDHLLFRTPACR